MFTTTSTLFVLQLFCSVTISDPEPMHKPLNNLAALFIQYSSPSQILAPLNFGLSTGCFGTRIDPKGLFGSTSYRRQTLLNVLSKTSSVIIGTLSNINHH